MSSAYDRRLIQAGRKIEGNNPPSLFHYHTGRVNIIVKAQILLHNGAFLFVLLDHSELHLADDVVSLAEKCKPIFKDALLLLRQILPLGSTVLRLERRLSEGSRGVFSGEHWDLGQLAIS